MCLSALSPNFKKIDSWGKPPHPPQKTAYRSQRPELLERAREAEAPVAAPVMRVVPDTGIDAEVVMVVVPPRAAPQHAHISIINIVIANSLVFG
jgi:hypothetical protein